MVKEPGLSICLHIAQYGISVRGSLGGAKPLPSLSQSELITLYGSFKIPKPMEHEDGFILEDVLGMPGFDLARGKRWWCGKERFP